MTTDPVVSELGNKWLPFAPEQFFTAQRAPDMWFGDELPPTLQAEMRSPLVTQSKALVQFQLLQNLAQIEQLRIRNTEVARRRHALTRVGKRVGTSRH